MIFINLEEDSYATRLRSCGKYSRKSLSVLYKNSKGDNKKNFKLDKGEGKKDIQ